MSDSDDFEDTYIRNLEIDESRLRRQDAAQKELAKVGLSLRPTRKNAAMRIKKAKLDKKKEKLEKEKLEKEKLEKEKLALEKQQAWF